MYKLCTDQSRSPSESTSPDIYPFFVIRTFNILPSMCSEMLCTVVNYVHASMEHNASNYHHLVLSDKELEVQKSESGYPRFPACPSVWKQGHALSFFLGVFSKGFLKGLVTSLRHCIELSFTPKIGYAPSISQ